MFTAAKIKASRKNGKDFYLEHLSNNDYYSEKSKIIGTWKGSLADEFNLNNQDVIEDVFAAFQQNINPTTNEKLTPRNKAGAVRFYDYGCSAQKSVSIMAMLDERLIKAHHLAVDLGMKELERLSAVRIRTGDNANTNNIEYTGNFIYAQYNHDSSRLLDPQLHTHNVIVNVTKTSDGQLKALETLEMARAIREAGKAYQNFLAQECIRLGYKIVYKTDDKGQRTGFEIADVSDDLCERYSKRSREIEDGKQEFFEQNGRMPDYKEVHKITLQTRSKKMLTKTEEEVQLYKESVMTEDEHKALKKASAIAQMRTGVNTLHLSPAEAKRQIESVVNKIFEREGVLTRDKIFVEVLNEYLGKTDIDVLDRVLDDIPGLINIGGNKANYYYSTSANIELEKYICDTADETKALLPPLNSDFKPFNIDDGLNHDEQKVVINAILDSTDRFMVLRGAAGAGKTSTLQELCKGLKAGGIKNIHVIAPTNSAVDVLREENFESSQTAAAFLMPNAKHPPKDSYLIVDESGLSSLKVGADIMKIAQEMNYRVLFVGDTRQHKSVEYGDFLRLLETYSLINKCSLTEIHRQRTEIYLQGVKAISENRYEDGFEIFDANGYIKEGKGKYLSEAVDSFLEFTDNGKNLNDCLMVSPTHEEGDKLTDELRKKLKEQGVLAHDEKAKTVFKSWNWTVKERNDLTKYSVGTTVFFNRSMRSVAQSGELLTVKAIGMDSILLSNGREMPLDNAADYINVGEPKDLQLSTGDLIRFTVNVKINGVKISNGSLARVGDKPNQFILLDAKEQKVTLPSNFAGFRYGWVSTSHASQGLTRKNVVIAAQKLAKDAFYVALSRGKFNCKLHVPDKEFFKEKLSAIKTERLAIKDLEAQGLLQKCAKEVEQSTTFDKSFLLPANRQPKIIVASKRRKILLKISDRNRIIKLGESCYERQRRTHQPIRTTGSRGESRGV